jgi:hypothetical protein
MIDDNVARKGGANRRRECAGYLRPPPGSRAEPWDRILIGMYRQVAGLGFCSSGWTRTNNPAKQDPLSWSAPVDWCFRAESGPLRSHPRPHFVICGVEERGLRPRVVVVVSTAGMLVGQPTLDLLIQIRLFRVATEPVAEEHDELRKRRVRAANVQDCSTLGIVKESLLVERGVRRIARTRGVPVNAWRVRPGPQRRDESGACQQLRELAQCWQRRHPHLQIDDRLRSEPRYCCRPDVLIIEMTRISKRGKRSLHLVEEALRSVRPARLVIDNHCDGHSPMLSTPSDEATSREQRALDPQALIIVI